MRSLNKDLLWLLVSFSEGLNKISRKAYKNQIYQFFYPLFDISPPPNFHIPNDATLNTRLFNGILSAFSTQLALHTHNSEQITIPNNKTKVIHTQNSLQPMLQIQNLQDLDIFNSPDFSRKTSDCLNQTNLTNLDSNEYCSIIHLHDSYKECRICLERTQDPQNSFASPCRCTGSLKYVHKICFITWLTRQLSVKSNKEQKSMKEEGIACEICKMKVYLEFKNYKQCLSSEEICSKIKTQPIYFALLLVFWVIITTSLSFIIYYMQNRNMSSFGVDVMATSVLVCALVFLVASAFFTVYYLINRYCMEERNKLESFTTEKKIRARTRKQTIPVERY